MQSCGYPAPGAPRKAAIAHSTPGQRLSFRVFASLEHARGRLLTRKRPSGSPSDQWAARQASQRMCSRRQHRPPTRTKPSRPQRPKPRPRTSPLPSSRTPSHPRRPRRLWASRARWALSRIQRHRRRHRNLRAHAGGPSARLPREGTSSRTGKRRRRRPRRFRRARTRRARRPPGACKRRRSAWMMT